MTHRIPSQWFQTFIFTHKCTGLTFSSFVFQAVYRMVFCWFSKLPECRDWSKALEHCTLSSYNLLIFSMCCVCVVHADYQLTVHKGERQRVNVNLVYESGDPHIIDKGISIGWGIPCFHASRDSILIKKEEEVKISRMTLKRGKEGEGEMRR